MSIHHSSFFYFGVSYATAASSCSITVLSCFFLVPCTCQPTNPSMECCRTPGVVASSLDKTTDASSCKFHVQSRLKPRKLSIFLQLLFSFQPTDQQDSHTKWNQNKHITSSRTAVFSHIAFPHRIDNCVVSCTTCGITVTRLQGFQKGWVECNELCPETLQGGAEGWNEIQSPNQGICRPPPSTNHPTSIVSKIITYIIAKIWFMIFCMNIQTENSEANQKIQPQNATGWPLWRGPVPPSPFFWGDFIVFLRRKKLGIQPCRPPASAAKPLKTCSNEDWPEIEEQNVIYQRWKEWDVHPHLVDIWLRYTDLLR